MTDLEAFQEARDRGGYISDSPAGTELVDSVIDEIISKDITEEPEWDWSIEETEYTKGDLTVPCLVLSASSEERNDFQPPDVNIFNYDSSIKLGLVTEEE